MKKKKNTSAQSIPLLLIPFSLTNKANLFLRGISFRFTHIFPIKDDLKRSNLGVTAVQYMSACLVNAATYFIVLFLLFYFVFSYSKDFDGQQALMIAVLLGFLFFFLLFFVLVRYPKIVAGKNTEQIDKNLIFAMKDLLLQVTSGVPVSDAIVSISNEDYGAVSAEFKDLARSMKAGHSLESALESLAERTTSTYLKRSLWQMLNSLKSGASLRKSLRIIISELVRDQRGKITSYAKELNLWSLIYMLFAVAIPSIGATMLVILSSFAGYGVTRASFVGFLGINLFVQIALIGLIKARRPVVNI